MRKEVKEAKKLAAIDGSIVKHRCTTTDILFCSCNMMPLPSTTI